MTDGNRLRAYRLKLRLSQKDLANILGLKSWVAAWESGRHIPPPYVWRALAKLENEKKRSR